MDKDSALIRDGLKKRIKAAGLRDKIRATRSGCLDQCEYGPTVVVYPGNIWYGGVSIDDVDEIFERTLLKGEVIERLVIPDRLLNASGKMEEVRAEWEAHRAQFESDEEQD